MTGEDLIGVITACNMEECEVAVMKGNAELKLTGIEIGGDKIVITVEDQ